MGFTRQALLDARVGFRFPMAVRFQDVDAVGIVFFARFLEYFHDGYVAFLGSVGHPLHVTLAESDWAAPLVHAEADFLAPLRFGDQVEVCLVASELDGSKVTIGYRIEGDGRVRAVGNTVHMFVERSSFRRTEIPPELAQAFRDLQG